MKMLKLELPLETFDSLHESADGRGKKCEILKEDLRLLLVDHARALAMLGDRVDDPGYKHHRNVV